MKKIEVYEIGKKGRKDKMQECKEKTRGTQKKK
jgi:hypothetical protein